MSPSKRLVFDRDVSVWKLWQILLLPAFCALTTFTFAQSDRDLHRYEDAVSKVQSQGDLSLLEQFVSTAPDGFLRTDALEWLAWRQWRRGEIAKAGHWADELLAGNSENALALAILAMASRSTAHANPDRVWADDPLRMAQRALRYVSSLKRPHSMPDAAFQKLKQDVVHDLSGSLGDVYFQRNLYAEARPYLRDVVSISPKDAHYVYALAIADLYGPNPNEAEGFTLLARAVNMARDTAAGQQLATFARNKYRERGGSDADWNRYLQVGENPVQLASAPKTPLVSEAASAKPVTSNASLPGARPSAPPSTSVARTSATSNVEVAGDLPTESVDIPYPTRHAEATGKPMSLGILVETSKTSGSSRRAVINSLSDMVRHLRDDDEAFLVSFSKNVVFEEDLTSDSKALEKALDNIKPREGTALLDAMTFAAGHLQRIGKNSRKVLLIVSDGEDQSAQFTPSEVVTHLSSSGVEIYCIGMGASSQIDESRLKAIARRTGGEAVFVANPDQFRTATREVASEMGISFR
jgi:tetratricopeptide (TPR) repeat protein